ncbi:MAG: 50S ribosomal protein L13 [Rickettsiales bacterium]
MKTFSISESELAPKWVLIDAKDLVLGRLASEIAMILRGKHRPEYTPHMNCGDCVVVINARHVHLTGNKAPNKKYYRHTGYPGGIKERVASHVLEGKFPERVLHKAVERMITRSPLGRAQMRKLYIYAEDRHPHGGQQPELYDFGSKNRKNAKSIDNQE